MKTKTVKLAQISLNKLFFFLDESIYQSSTKFIHNTIYILKKTKNLGKGGGGRGEKERSHPHQSFSFICDAYFD